MSSRISLGDAFPEWTRQKGIYNKLRLSSEPSTSISFVMYPSLPEGQKARKSIQPLVPSSKFVNHLLDVHGEHCCDCTGTLMRRTSEPPASTSTSTAVDVSTQTDCDSGDAETAQASTGGVASDNVPAAQKNLYDMYGGLFLSPIPAPKQLGGFHSIISPTRFGNSSVGVTSTLLKRPPAYTASTPICPKESDSKIGPTFHSLGRDQPSQNKASRRALFETNISSTWPAVHADNDSEDEEYDHFVEDDDEKAGWQWNHSFLNNEPTVTDQLNRSMEDEVLDFDVEEDLVAEETADVPIIVTGDENPGDAKIAAKILISKKKCIAYTSQIVPLLKKVYGSNCKVKKCDGKLVYRPAYFGTCLKVNIECTKGHSNTSWDSQPMFRRNYAGNLQLALSLLYSGNSFQKVALMCKFMGLAMFQKTLFYSIQRLYGSEAVDEYWLNMQQVMLSDINASQPNGVVLSSDGRMDSPGYSAQYCTSSFMDNTTDHTIHVDITDVREVQGKSTNMEKFTFNRGISYLNGLIKIQQVVTDAHPQIIPLMKTEAFKDITHQVDVWHGGKNLTKRLTKLSSFRQNKALQPWIPAIRNHFWYVAKECGGNVVRMKAMWMGLLHHVVNEHEWPLMTDGEAGSCQHGPLDPREEQDRPWLVKGSPAHRALRGIVTEKRVMRMMQYYCNFLHTGRLESFHNHILMYAPKRHSYTFDGYKTRNLLAAIDHNKHVGRPLKKTDQGENIVEGHFNKRTKSWVPAKVREAKEYKYMPELLVFAFMKRFKDKKGVNQKAEMKEGDPKAIFPNRYMVPKPTLQRMMEDYQHKTRYQQQNE